MDRIKIFTGISWRFAERIGAQLVAFTVNIIMARLLSPDDYGVIALAAVFLSVLKTISDSGIQSALIRKDRVDAVDYSTAFYFHLAFSVFLYAVLFFCSPAIAAFYRKPELSAVIRVISLSLVLSGVHAIPEASIVRSLRFKLYFYSTLTGTVVSAVAGILMALNGFGVWALVAQQLTNAAIDALILFLASKWRPERLFSFKRLKSLLDFGWMIMAATLASLIYDNLRQLIIGKLHSTASLGIYNKGEQLPNVIMINVNTPLQSALYPVLSASSHEPQKVRSMLDRSIDTVSYVSAPMMAGLALLAPRIVRFLLTEKWLPCVPFVRVFCLVYFFFPIQECNRSALKALGRSRLYLATELLRKGIGVLLLLAAMRISAWAVCLSLIPFSLIVMVIDGAVSGLLLDYGLTRQLKTMIAPALLSLFMGACILPIGLIGLPDGPTILLQMLAGAFIYIAASMLLRLDSFLYLRAILVSLLKR